MIKRSFKKLGSLAAIAAAFPILLSGGILIRLAIARHQAPHPQAILTLGGDPERSEFTAQFARKHPALDIWVSSGVSPKQAYPIFRNANIPPNRVHLNYEALDTVTNFTSLVDEFKRLNIRHVYVITSDYHMPRAQGIATIVLGSHGIAFTPVSVPTEHPQEPWLFTLLDASRSMVWFLTGYSGASLNRYFSYDQLTRYFSSTHRYFFAKSHRPSEYWRKGLTVRVNTCCNQSKYYKDAINFNDSWDAPPQAVKLG